VSEHEQLAGLGSVVGWPDRIMHKQELARCSAACVVGAMAMWGWQSGLKESCVLNCSSNSASRQHQKHTLCELMCIKQMQRHGLRQYRQPMLDGFQPAAGCGSACPQEVCTRCCWLRLQVGLAAWRRA
jgi:hypothetical protein